MNADFLSLLDDQRDYLPRTIKPNPPLTDTKACPPPHASVGGELSNVSPAAGELTDCCEHSRQSGFSSRGGA